MTASAPRLRIGRLAAAVAVCLIVAAVTVSGLLLTAPPVHGQGAASLTILAGTVEVRTGSSAWRQAQDKETLVQGERIRTNAKGRALIHFFDNSSLRLDGGTQVVIRTLSYNGSGSSFSKHIVTGVTFGRVWARVTKLLTPDSSFQVSTPTATAEVRGTQFEVDYHIIKGHPVTHLLTFEGTVAVTAAGQTVEVPAGEQTVALASTQPEAPTAITPDELDIFYTLNQAIDVQEGNVTNPAGAIEATPSPEDVPAPSVAAVLAAPGANALISGNPDVPADSATMPDSAPGLDALAAGQSPGPDSTAWLADTPVPQGASDLAVGTPTPDPAAVPGDLSTQIVTPAPDLGAFNPATNGETPAAGAGIAPTIPDPSVSVGANPNEPVAVPSALAPGDGQSPQLAPPPPAGSPAPTVGAPAVSPPSAGSPAPAISPGPAIPAPADSPPPATQSTPAPQLPALPPILPTI